MVLSDLKFYIIFVSDKINTQNVQKFQRCLGHPCSASGDVMNKLGPKEVAMVSEMNRV